MTVITDQLHFIGLNEREVRVFTALSTFGRMNMTKISSRAGLSRTTVDAIVRRLVSKGLVAQEKVAGHFEYSVKLHEVADKLDWIEKRLRPVEVRELGRGDTGQSEVLRLGTNERVKGGDLLSAGGTLMATDSRGETFEGRDAIREVVAHSFAQHTRERATLFVSSLEPTPERIQRLEQSIVFARDAEVKLDLLATRGVVKIFSSFARELLGTLASYDLRLHFLPPSCCFEHIDVVAFRDVVFLVNQHVECAERVSSAHAVLALNHLLMVAREVGWSIDMKMWLEGIRVSQA